MSAAQPFFRDSFLPDFLHCHGNTWMWGFGIIPLDQPWLTRIVLWNDQLFISFCENTTARNRIGSQTAWWPRMNQFDKHCMVETCWNQQPEKAVENGRSVVTVCFFSMGLEVLIAGWWLATVPLGICHYFECPKHKPSWLDWYLGTTQMITPVSWLHYWWLLFGYHCWVIIWL